MASTQQHKFEGPTRSARQPAHDLAKPLDIEKKHLIETDAASLFALAKHYGHAAQLLSKPEGKSDPMRWHPYRLNATHAIELCLSAYLMQKGMTFKQVCSIKHDLSKRASAAKEKGLVLRNRTISHLASMDEGKEYLMSRYNPALSDMWHPEQVKATLNDLFEKTGKAFN